MWIACTVKFNAVQVPCTPSLSLEKKLLVVSYLKSSYTVSEHYAFFSEVSFWHCCITLCRYGHSFRYVLSVFVLFVSFPQSIRKRNEFCLCLGSDTFVHINGSFFFCRTTVVWSEQQHAHLWFAEMYPLTCIFAQTIVKGTQFVSFCCVALSMCGGLRVTHIIRWYVWSEIPIMC